MKVIMLEKVGCVFSFFFSRMKCQRDREIEGMLLNGGLRTHWIGMSDPDL